ncbi:MAG: TrkH family potassium uptake protein, partial [Bacteroidaceae bacterium]
LINPKMLCRVLGQLMLIESFMMLVCLFVGVLYEEPDHTPFLVSLGVTTVCGVVLRLVGLKATNTINRRESYLVVALTWVIFSILGMIPFMLSGSCTTLGTAFFESMSGFTTTGASVIKDIDNLPHSILFWRSFTHWIGGLGIVFFTMTIMPVAGRGDVKLFAAESTGLGQEKLHSKIKTTAAWIWSIYISLTIGCCLSLWAGGMDFFDSINHAMSTISTGGYSTHGSGISYYNSPLIEYILIFFMFLGGVNFYILYTVGTKRTLTPIKHSSELKLYLGIIITVSLICATTLVFYNGYDVEHALRSAFFNCIAINTTTGLTTDDYQSWFHPTAILIMFLMFAGANSGSTSGGFKSIRILIIIKATQIHFKRILHPNAIIPVQVNKTPISHDAERNVMSLMFWFAFMIVAGTVALTCVGISDYDSFNISLASVCNIGTNFGHTYGPTIGLADMPESAKWICSFLMLAGRLEIFAILLPFTRSFWQRQ